VLNQSQPLTPLHLLAVGLRYTTATIDLREQVAFSEAELPEALRLLTHLPAVEEAVILTTCNRVELYLAVTDLSDGLQSVAQFFKQTKHLVLQHHPNSHFTYLGEDAVKHLLAVAGGLDSLIVGEGQILGQVKDALALAQRQKTAGTLLKRLFIEATTTGKRIRQETGLACRDASLSRSAWQLANQLDPHLPGKQLVVVGGGKMVELLLAQMAKALPAEVACVTVLNRSLNRLETLLAPYASFKAQPFDATTPALLAQADYLWVATGAPHILFHPPVFENRTKPLTIFDLSVPRNVCPTVETLPLVTLFNTDTLAKELAVSPNPKQAEALSLAKAIVNQAYEQFVHWQRLQRIQPTVVTLRQQAETIRLAVLERFNANHPAEDTELSVEAIDYLSKLLINKLLHNPTVELKQQIANSHYDEETLTHWVKGLFGLETNAVIQQ
jgi:glutamyl-tRNA reductase